MDDKKTAFKQNRMKKTDKTSLLSYQDYPKEPVVIDNLSMKFMKESKFIPLLVEDNILHIAISDPQDFSTIDSLKLAYGFDIKIFASRKEDISEAIERLYGAGSQSMEMIIEEAGKDIYDISPGKENDIGG